MTNVTPIRETVQHHLGNAAQIAELWANEGTPLGWTGYEAAKAFGAIRDHLKAALEQLGEPNLAAVQAAATMMREYDDAEREGRKERNARDAAAAVLHAQITGNTPKTWTE